MIHASSRGILEKCRRHKDIIMSHITGVARHPSLIYGSDPICVYLLARETCTASPIHTLSINQTTSKHGHDSITLRVHLLEIQLKHRLLVHETPALLNKLPSTFDIL